MKLLKDIRVLISGASVAGLTTAYWLIKYGFLVTVVERAPHLRPGGQALDVRGPALEVAARMEILQYLRKNSTKLNGMSVVDAATGAETFRSTERTMTGGKLDSSDVEIMRDDLCRVLFQAVGNQPTYIFDDSIEAINQEETGVTVTFVHAVPQRFDLVIGADGLRSNVRRIVFGADGKFIRYLGYYIATFTMPNIFELDHWEVFFQHQGVPVAACIFAEKERGARTYVGFGSAAQISYDYRDIAAQKQLITGRLANIGDGLTKILAGMQHAADFYFDSTNQVIMDNWSVGRVVLVGDAGYSVSPALGQGTTIAMIGAYVLAGKLYMHQHDLQEGVQQYENELRQYINSNQQLAYESATAAPSALGESSEEYPDGVPDFGQTVIPIALKNYL